MADNNINTPLLSLIDENAFINHYYITDDPNTIISAGDNGDIIIYVSNGEGFENDRDREDKENPYTDIYVGNEHIAGGFGFKDINTRNKVLTDIQDLNIKEEQNFTYLNQKLTALENSKNYPVSVHENKRFITFDNGDEYELTMNSRNVISLLKHHRITVNDLDIRYYLNNDTENVKTLNIKDESIFVSVSDTINIVGFDVVVESSENIAKFDLSYIMPVFDNGNPTYSEVSKGIDSLSPSNECYQLTEVNYEIAEGEKYVWISRFEENFETPKTIRAYNNLNYSIKLRLIAKTETNDSIVVFSPSISFTHPIYYATSIFEYEESFENFKNVKEIVDYKLNENNRLVFEHDKTIPSYGFILVPRYWYDSGYIGEFYYHDQLSIQMAFEYGNNSITINNIQYTQYRTPKMYNKTVTWDFKLIHREEK